MTLPDISNFEHWVDRVILYGLVVVHALQRFGVYDFIKGFFVKEVAKVEAANPAPEEKK